MKTANIPMYGNIAVYVKYCGVCLKIDYTLRCYQYICFQGIYFLAPLFLLIVNTLTITLLVLFNHRVIIKNTYIEHQQTENSIQGCQVNVTVLYLCSTLSIKSKD